MLPQSVESKLTDSNSIETKLLKERNITLAILNICKGIRKLALATRLVVNSTDVELPLLSTS
jgi:hypothetical protein